MTSEPQALEPLVDLGLGRPQAEVYLALVQLSTEGSPTGYQVAKFLGKDTSRVYKSLAELERLGAVEVVAGRGKQYRPLAPQELVRHLRRGFERRSRAAVRALSDLQPTPPDEEMILLRGRERILDRLRSLLEAARTVALL